MTDVITDRAPSRATADLPDAILDKVDGVLDGYIAAGDLPGAVTLIAQHGRVLRLRSSGLSDVASGRPLAADAIFRAFSMTKPVTGTAMMILRDEGHWRPEDPIARHLPEFEGVEVQVGVDEAGRVLTEPANRAPTMADLMSHRAGLAYGLDLGELADPDLPYYRDARLNESKDLRDFVERLASIPLAYQPGTQWRYSWAMDVQGAIIERLARTSLPEFMRKRLFEPLGMTDTAFHVPETKRDRLVQLHFRAEDGSLAPIDNPVFPDPSSDPAFAWGGGGLYTTAIDYARYGQLLLDRGFSNGRRIVSEAAIAEQMTNLLPEQMLETGFQLGRHRFRPGYGFGYNGVVVSDPEAADLPVGAGTYFWDGAAGTWFWIDPVHRLLFVGMIQVIYDGSPKLQEETQRVIGEAWAERPAHIYTQSQDGR